MRFLHVVGFSNLSSKSGPVFLTSLFLSCGPALTVPLWQLTAVSGASFPCHRTDLLEKRLVGVRTVPGVTTNRTKTTTARATTSNCCSAKGLRSSQRWAPVDPTVVLDQTSASSGDGPPCFTSLQGCVHHGVARSLGVASVASKIVFLPHPQQLHARRNSSTSPRGYIYLGRSHNSLLC